MSDMAEKHQTGAIRDVESDSSHNGTVEHTTVDTLHAPKVGASLWAKLAGAGIEMRGAEPVPVEKRTDENYAGVFFIFATSMTSLLP